MRSQGVPNVGDLPSAPGLTETALTPLETLRMHFLRIRLGQAWGHQLLPHTISTMYPAPVSLIMPKAAMSDACADKAGTGS